MSKVIMADEGQQDTDERAEVLARAVKRHLAEFRAEEVRAAVSEAVKARQERQRLADKKRNAELKARALEFGFSSVASMNTALINKTHAVTPRLPDGYKPRRGK